jgi:adenylate kinase|tara:strand:- start:188 stop:787 length:600 start_codon:yes stop_codon:yes gene_type:complete
MDTFKQHLFNNLMEAKQTRVVIMGGPGSGKSTYSEYIVRHFGIKHIYPGGLLRKEIENGGPEGQKIKDLLDQGKFAPNEIVLNLVKKALQDKGASKGYVLDGYPRYMQQVRDMESNGITYDVVIYLDVSSEEVIRRLTKRGRKDDKPDIINDRIGLYKKETGPAIEHFKKRPGFVSVKAEGKEPGDIAKNIIKEIENAI